MAATYPSAIPSFTTKVDNTDVNMADHVNRLQDEVRAVTNELGVLPKGSYASVRSRLEALNDDKATASHTHNDLYWSRSLITSKGQVIVGTAAGTATAVVPGPDDRVFISDSSTSSGVRWGELTHSMFSDISADSYPQYARADGSRGAFLPIVGGTLTGKVVLDSYAEKVEALGTVSGAVTLDADVASAFTLTLGGATSISLTGAVDEQVNTVTALITQGGSGLNTITWPGSVVWVGSGEPAPDDVGNIALVSLTSFGDGSTWVGIALEQF